PRYHKKIPPNANILGFLYTLIITYLAKFGWNYLEEFLLFRAAKKGSFHFKLVTRLSFAAKIEQFSPQIGDEIEARRQK
ncbi:hypothetical protein M4A92_11345, partial [Caldibacillus thermoamylovorans]|uniref:hypothetical protein n=1 Tax=Caldibacillus thermoamylovorans TaxID=35841 RepID=UPI00203A3CA2